MIKVINRNNHTLFRSPGILAAGILMTGCQGEVNVPSAPSGDEISFARDVQPIFTRQCVSCHTAGSPTSTFAGLNMVLTQGNAFDSLVNQPSGQRDDLTLVVPGDAESSLLWLKVSSNNPPVGSTMPLLGAPLTGDELATIRDWINQGAEDN
jgi:hypothetical protein